MRNNQTVGADSEDEFDDIAETNCELAMVEGQLCSVAYELYDLPDLMGIFSVDTWNSLSEEERLRLSCFLPDMDQATFRLTVQELFGGANLYFGNPVDKFYKKLQGGLLAPKVACCKEGVTFVKRKIYYHSLKFYHEKMIKTFTEMQRLWGQYGKELSNKARILFWSERTRNRNLKLLDLNRVPAEEMDGATRSLANFNIVRSVERNRAKSLNIPRSGGSKNTLKFKITEKGVFQSQSSGLVSSRDDDHHQTLPKKGFLKVLPKASSAIFREPYASPENSLLPIHETGSKSIQLAASPYFGARFGNPYGTMASLFTELPNCLLNHQDSSFTDLETARKSSIHRTKPVFHDPALPISRGLGASNHSITQRNLPTEQEEYVRYHLKSPGLKPRNVDISSETMEKKRILSGENFQSNANVLQKPLYVLSEDDHTQEANDDHLLSMTYKRRKVERIGVA